MYYLPLSLKGSSYSFTLNLSSAISSHTRSQIFYTREEIIHWIISLILDIFPYCGFIKPYCTHVITFRPEMSIPKLI